MRKEFVIVIVLLILIFIGNYATEKYTNESIEAMLKKLENIEKDLLEESPDNKMIEDKVKQVEEEWDRRFEVLAYYIEHDELEKINTEIVSLKASVMAEDYEQGMPDLERCEFILKHIKQKSAFQIKNIF